MASPVPTPVAAAIGLFSAYVETVRSLPGRAVQLPVIAVSSAITAVGAARKEYDELAERGERVIAKLRGQSLDELEDRFEDSLQDTPFAQAYDKIEDSLEDAGATVSRLTRRGSATARRSVLNAGMSVRETARATENSTEAAASTAAATVRHTAAQARKDLPASAAQQDTPAGTQDTPAGKGRSAGKAGQAGKSGQSGPASRSGPARTPSAKATGPTRKAGKRSAKGGNVVRDAAASAADTALDVVEKATGADLTGVQDTLPEQSTPAAEAPKGAPTPKATQPDDTRVDTAASAEVVEQVEHAAAAAPAKVPDHDELPLPDYDHMTLGSLRGRLRSLDVNELVAVRAYEKAHANRLPVVTMLDNRIAKLSTGESTPSGGASSAPAPEQVETAKTPTGDSKVSPATTTAPAINPPSAGDPTNPAQPR